MHFSLLILDVNDSFVRNKCYSNAPLCVSIDRFYRVFGSSVGMNQCCIQILQWTVYNTITDIRNNVSDYNRQKKCTETFHKYLSSTPWIWLAIESIKEVAIHCIFILHWFSTNEMLSMRWFCFSFTWLNNNYVWNWSPQFAIPLRVYFIYWAAFFSCCSFQINFLFSFKVQLIS